MEYLFCLIVDCCIMLLIGWLGYLVYKSDSLVVWWLIPVMIVVSLSFTIPAIDLFKCPECGHEGRLKIFQNTVIDTVIEDKNDGNK